MDAFPRRKGILSPTDRRRSSPRKKTVSEWVRVLRQVGFDMSLWNQPLRFDSYARPMVWGGRALADRLGKELPDNALYGESWEVSDHATHRSVVASGPWAETSLRRLMEEHRQSLLGPAGSRCATFPWLIKFLDVRDWLSVQVHPDEDTVKRLWPEEAAKTECWFVLDADEGSRVYAGLLPGVGPRELRAALRRGTVVECLHSFAPRQGDFVFLPAGTVHAVGGGVLLAEIQQTSDTTFRLFDWDRRDAQGRARALHVDQAIAAIHWDQGPVEPIRLGDYASPENGDSQRPLVRCSAFEVGYRTACSPFAVAGTGNLQALVVLAGKARLGDAALSAGQVCVLPAAMEAAVCSPEPYVAVLECRMP